MERDRDLNTTDRELLIRLDERTERLDRDVRQMIHGQTAHGEKIERSLNELTKRFDDEVASLRSVAALNDKRSSDALAIATETREWITWATRLILASVILAVLTVIGLAT